MIKEVRLKGTKKIKRYYKKKYYKKNITKKRSNNKKDLKNSIQESKDTNKESKEKNVLKSTLQGGSKTSKYKENFEVKRLSDIDYSEFSLSKRMSAEQDWGSSPGPPPTDCSIM